MTYVLIGLRRSGKCLPTLFACTNFRFRPSGSSYTALMSFLHEGRPLVFPSSLSLPSEERDGGGWSRDALVLLPEGFPLLPLDFGPAGGVEEPLVVRSVHGSSLLSPRFIRGLGFQELLSCGGLLLSVLSRLALPPQLCTLGEVLGRGNLRGLSLFLVASPASSLHVRGIATSLNYYSNLSISAIKEAATWKSNRVFAMRYLKDMSSNRSRLKGMGPLIATGSAVHQH